MLKQDKVLHIYGFHIVFLYLTCGEMGEKILVLGGEMGKKILVLGGEMGKKILVLGGKKSKKILV